MGYLIESNALSNYKQFIIPFADILSGSFELNSNLAPNEYWFCTFASFRLINSPSGVLRGFTIFSLRQSLGANQAIYDNVNSSNPNSLVIDEYYTFTPNIQLSPTTYGCFTKGPKYIMQIQGSYISGDGDIELNFYYNRVAI
jgi:hypothetical protein